MLVENEKSNDQLVSIVVPTYNQAKYLEESIESILNQDYPNIELIVLNDGSTDETAKILTKYRGNDKVKYDSHANMGQAATLNKGWHLASGKYLGYLSSDDVIHRECVRQIVDLLRENPKYICAYPNSSLIDKNSRIVRARVCKPFSLEELIVKQECYIGPGALFRREAFELFGGWNPSLRLGPDREYWMRLSSIGEFAFIDEVLAGYRYHSGSISYRPATEDISRQYIDILDDYFSKENVPEKIKIRKNEAYGHANFRVAINCFRSGCIQSGTRYYKRAYELYPPLRGLGAKMILVKNIIGKPMRQMICAITGIARLNR